MRTGALYSGHLSPRAGISVAALAASFRRWPDLPSELLSRESKQTHHDARSDTRAENKTGPKTRSLGPWEDGGGVLISSRERGRPRVRSHGPFGKRTRLDGLPTSSRLQRLCPSQPPPVLAPSRDRSPQTGDPNLLPALSPVFPARQTSFLLSRLLLSIRYSPETSYGTKGAGASAKTGRRRNCCTVGVRRIEVLTVGKRGARHGQTTFPALMCSKSRERQPPPRAAVMRTGLRRPAVALHPLSGCYG